jgi:hypothetical protein
MTYKKTILLIIIMLLPGNYAHSLPSEFNWGVFSNVTLSNYEFGNGEPFQIASSGVIYPSVTQSNPGFSAPFGFIVNVGLGEYFVFNLRAGIEYFRSHVTLENSTIEKAMIVIDGNPIEAEFKSTFTFNYAQLANIYFINPNLEYQFQGSSFHMFFGLTYSLLENKGEMLEFSNYEEIIKPENITFPNGTRRNEINGQLELSPSDRTIHSFGVDAGFGYTFVLYEHLLNDEWYLRPVLRFSYYIIPREYELIDDFDLAIKQLPLISFGLSLLF